MKGFERMVRDSIPARFATALLTAALITSGTFLPSLIQGAAAKPTPQTDPEVYGSPLVDGLYPDPELCHGNCSWIHDPSIWYENGTYWRFSTSGNIAIATASSLWGPWRYQGALLHHGTSIFVSDAQDIWVSAILSTPICYPAIRVN
jgi:arabinan endo-1,5-alpha-L-arabinosidase